MDMAAERSDSMLVRAGRMFVLVTSGALAAMVQLAIIPSLTNMSKYFADQGDGTFLSQMVLIIPAPAMVLGAPFAGWLAERIGKRPLLLGSALLYAIAGGAGLILPDLWTLLASRVLVGLAAAGLSTAALSLLGDYYEHDRRDRLIGWNAVIGGAGSFVGLPIAGLLAADLGWRGPFFIYLVGLVIFAVALVTLGKSRSTVETVAAESGTGGSVRGALIFCLLAAAISIVMYMVSLNGAYLLDAHGIASPSTQSLVIDLTTGASMVGAYMFGVLRKWISYIAAMALTWAVLGVGTLGFGISERAGHVLHLRNLHRAGRRSDAAFDAKRRVERGAAQRRLARHRAGAGQYLPRSVLEFGRGDGDAPFHGYAERVHLAGRRGLDRHDGHVAVAAAERGASGGAGPIGPAYART